MVLDSEPYNPLVPETIWQIFSNYHIEEKNGQRVVYHNPNNLAWMLFVDIGMWSSFLSSENRQFLGWELYAYNENGLADILEMYEAIATVLRRAPIKELDHTELQNICLTILKANPSKSIYLRNFGVTKHTLTKAGLEEHLSKVENGYYDNLGFKCEILNKGKKLSLEDFEKELVSTNDPTQYYSTPECKDSSLANNKILQRYNEQIKSAKRDDEELSAIVELVQNFERLHQLEDKNCRFNCVLLFNYLLINKGFGVTINFDPNKFDGHSVQELVNLTKNSLARTKFLFNNLKRVPSENKFFSYNLESQEEFNEIFSSHDNSNQPLISAKQFLELMNQDKPRYPLPILFDERGLAKSSKEIIQPMQEQAKRYTYLGKFFIERFQGMLDKLEKEKDKEGKKSIMWEIIETVTRKRRGEQDSRYDDFYDFSSSQTVQEFEDYLRNKIDVGTLFSSEAVKTALDDYIFSHNLWQKQTKHLPTNIDAYSMLRKGIDINNADRFGRTALMKTSNLIALRRLIEEGADVNAVDRSGKTVLMHYINSVDSNIEGIKTLIKGGAIINKEDQELLQKKYKDSMLTLLELEQNVTEYTKIQSEVVKEQEKLEKKQENLELIHEETTDELNKLFDMKRLGHSDLVKEKRQEWLRIDADRIRSQESECQSMVNKLNKIEQNLKNNIHKEKFSEKDAQSYKKKLDEIRKNAELIKIIPYKSYAPEAMKFVNEESKGSGLKKY